MAGIRWIRSLVEDLKRQKKQFPKFIYWVFVWGPHYGRVNYKNKVEYLVIHHGGGSKRGSAAKYNCMHTRDRRWTCIGYQYVICSDSSRECGRYERMNGSHAPGLNRRSLGLCCVGNFEKYRPGDDQLVATTLLAAELCQRYKIPVKKIIDHNTVYKRFWNRMHPNKKRSTKCAGKFFPMDEFRQAVQELLNTGVQFRLEVI